MAAGRSDQEVEERGVDGEDLADGGEVGDPGGGLGGGGGEDGGRGVGEGGEGEVEGADVGVYCCLRSIYLQPGGGGVSMRGGKAVMDGWMAGEERAYSRNSTQRRTLGGRLSSRLL